MVHFSVITLNYIFLLCRDTVEYSDDEEMKESKDLFADESSGMHDWCSFDFFKIKMHTGCFLHVSSLSLSFSQT